VECGYKEIMAKDIYSVHDFQRDVDFLTGKEAKEIGEYLEDKFSLDEMYEAYPITEEILNDALKNHNSPIYKILKKQKFWEVEKAAYRYRRQLVEELIKAIKVIDK